MVALSYFFEITDKIFILLSLKEMIFNFYHLLGIQLFEFLIYKKFFGL